MTPLRIDAREYEVPQPVKPRLHAWIEEYIHRYQFEQAKARTGAPPLASTLSFVPRLYVGVIAHMLLNAGIEPKRPEELHDALTRLWKDKVVLEIGCRKGEFLSLAKAHGARVAGSTDKAKIKDVRDNLGLEDAIVLSDARNAWKKIPKHIKPDLLVCLNQFDANRWKTPHVRYPLFSKVTETPRQLLENIARAAQRNTKCYIHPSLDTTSVLPDADVEHVAKSGSVTTAQCTSRLMGAEVIHDYTFSFRPHERFARAER